MDILEIKQYMKRNKITYEQLSERSQLSISTIKKIFSGISQYPRIDTMQAIERALGLEEQKTPPNDLSEDEKRLAMLIAQMTETEVAELETFVDYIISKRAK
jgi:transcriptional regulator with XRE-family HTH domain